MKEQLPAPDFDTTQYERPTQDWVCGWAAEGHSCRIGPDGLGRCRATFECRPVSEAREGETKGGFRCTRPKEYGGPCELGPLPDGTCSRPIPRCQPVRSLRAKRGLFTAAVLALTVGFLLVMLYRPNRLEFIKPGEVSKHHTGSAFAKMNRGAHPGAESCAACHPTAGSGPGSWLQAGFNARPGPFQFEDLFSVTKADITTIDHACLRCHPDHNFHEPNVVRDYSCSACHREHLGSGPMKQPENANCASCHADSATMEASFRKGVRLGPQAFDFRLDHGRVPFKPPRPPRGSTHVFRSFAEDHPEFQIHAQKLRENNTLKFNHEKHLVTGAIPPLKGNKLDCRSCHKPDPAGTYHQKITYEASCRPCHSLQFDARIPELTLPHGSAATVHAFLRSLPTQYADYATSVKKLANKRDVDQFVNDQMRELNAEFLSGENLEQQIFSNGNPRGPSGADRPGDSNRAKFAGCAYCHEVLSTSDPFPEITKPVIPDRWMTRGNFNHAKHANVDCERCHQVEHSRDTSDILLPSKRTCATCHSPQGGVRDTCATCHSYHTTDRKKVPSADLRK